MAEILGPQRLGPLTPLVGEWEGNVGVDLSYHNEDDLTGETGYFEKAWFRPIPKQENGKQSLEGLTYQANTFEVLSAGTQTTVQDFPGRLGYWAVGVPPSGPMDDRALRLGNRLLGNLLHISPQGIRVCGRSGLGQHIWETADGADGNIVFQVQLFRHCLHGGLVAFG